VGRRPGVQPAHELLCHTVDQRFVLEDMFAKLARFARGEQPFATFT
jgi:hypothetical protein